MVAVLARLQLTLQRRELSRSTGRLIGVVAGALFGALVVFFGIVGFLALGSASAAEASSVAILLASTLIVCWIVLPLLIFGVDATLDPAKFALLPLSVRQLRPALVIAGLIGVPGVVTALLVLTPALTWVGRDAGATIAALLMAPVVLLTCFFAARALTATFASALASRRFKDVAAVLLGIVALTAGISTNLISTRAANNPEAAKGAALTAADITAWTPLGWAAAVPGDLAQGSWSTALIRLVLALGLLGGLWVLWGRMLGRALTSTSEVGASTVGRGSGLIDRIYPATPTGAVAARCLRYWRRDPRYVVSIVSIVILPVLVGVSTSLSASSAAMVGMPMLMAAMSAPGLLADLAYDHSALWTHVATGISGRTDRLGRALAQLTVVGPLILVAYLAGLALSGRWDWALGVLAITLSLLLVGFGLGLLIGSHYPGQAPPPGTNPFGSGGSGSGLITGLVLLGAIALTAVLSAPVIIAVLLGIDSQAVQAAALLGALVWGGGIAAGCIGWGGKLLDQRWPELLQRVSTEKS